MVTEEREADPIAGISGDDVHVHPDEGENFPGDGPGVLDDDITPFGEVGDVVNDKGAAAGGGAEGEEGVEDVLDDPVLLGDQIGGVVLHELGLPDELREEGCEGLLVELAERVLHARGRH